MDKTEGITVIDVVNNLGKYRMIPVSDFISELEYIPLQTTRDCLVGESIRDIIVTSAHIFITGPLGLGSFCYAFSRDGKFIGEIGSVGQGPGEYQFITRLSIDEKNQSLYLEASVRNLLEYSLDGVFRKSIDLPKNMGYLSTECVYPLSNNLFIGHIPNDRGSEEYNFILFNDSGQVIKSFVNHVKFERSGNWISGFDGAMKPFKVKQSLYLKEFTNDTLYCLNAQNELIPQYVFNLGKYAFPQHLKETYTPYASYEASYKDIITIPNRKYYSPMTGITNYFFFTFDVPVLGSIPVPKGRDRITTFSGQMIEFEERFPVGIYDIATQRL